MTAANGINPILPVTPKNASTPFLKWAGGKRWLADKIKTVVPEKIETYYEPFLGSGAIFFKLQPKKAVLSDLNEKLISTYLAIKDDWKKVEQHLAIHAKAHSKEYYYKVREQQFRTSHTSAAQFIYLNRTCWNGLYRVNRNGQFNVPVGTKTNVILETDDFEALAQILKNVELQCVDFEKTIDRANVGDLIFADPPYTVHHNHNGFVKYNENIFSWEDQVRLSNALRRAKDRGVKIIVTNANHESVRNLYSEEFSLLTMSRKSVIAGSTSARKDFDELLIISP